LAGFCTREAPIEPQSIARHVRSAEARQPGGQRPLRRPQLVSGAVAWLTSAQHLSYEFGTSTRV
jgi:hypothetical protein